MKRRLQFAIDHQNTSGELLEHRVIAYSGHRHAQEPREFLIGEERHTVNRVLDTWLEQTPGLEGLTRQVWRVTDQDGRLYKLTHYRSSDFWEIEPE